MSKKLRRIRLDEGDAIYDTGEHSKEQMRLLRRYYGQCAIGWFIVLLDFYRQDRPSIRNHEAALRYGVRLGSDDIDSSIENIEILQDG